MHNSKNHHVNLEHTTVRTFHNSALIKLHMKSVCVHIAVVENKFPTTNFVN